MTHASANPPRIALRLHAAPAAVAPVRHCVAGIAENAGLDAERVAHLKTIVSEACNNVVLHAYGPEGGPLEVEVAVEADGIWVTVRDYGAGMRPEPTAGPESLGIGLQLIASLSDTFEIRGGQQRGTEIRARVAHDETSPLEQADSSAGAGAPASGEIRASFVPDEHNARALSRLVAATAAQSQLPVDRLEEATLVTEAVARRALDGFSLDRPLDVRVDGRNDGVEIRLGPIEDGAGERLLRELDLPGIEASLAQLASHVAIEPSDDEGAETLVIAFGP